MKSMSYINYQKFRTFLISDKVFSEIKKRPKIFCDQSLKASEIFRDLVVLYRYFSNPISSFLDENILTYFLFTNSNSE